MAIIEGGDSQSNGYILNIHQIRELLSLYKLPLILAGVGVLFLLTATVILVKSQFASSEVVFSSAESSPSGKIANTKIHIDIEGAVIRPGVYALTDNDRITQALAVAGGLSADADRDWLARNLNLAAKLADGGKIYIPSLAETSEGKAQNSNVKSQNLSNLSNPSNLLGMTSGKVNINTATQAELEALPGIGPVTARKIISGRPYQAIEDLKSRKIVGNAVFMKIKDLLVVY